MRVTGLHWGSSDLGSRRGIIYSLEFFVFLIFHEPPKISENVKQESRLSDGIR
jgi:hypothetical protein